MLQSMASFIFSGIYIMGPIKYIVVRDSLMDGWTCWFLIELDIVSL